MLRRLTALPVRLLVAIALLAALLPVVAMPSTVVAGDFTNASGRLIVIWRTDAPRSVSMAGVVQSERSANRRRSLVVAAAGQTSAVIARLRTDPRIAAILPDGLMTATDWPSSGAPNDSLYAGNQADLPLIGVPTAWQTTTGSPSVIVAVLDTGMTRTHADLDGVSVVSPRNEIANTTDVADGKGHGTHVIGTIAAETNNGIGVAGIAPGVSIMPIKVLDDTGSGWLSDIMDGVDYARINGAKVISMSIGGPLDAGSVGYFQPTFDAAYAAGITIIAAAGNDGTTAISYPGGFAHVLSIAATDDRDAHAYFSQVNATVDLSAPGVAIASTYKNGGYSVMSGTSMATPHVAGVAALVRSAHPTYTVSQIDAALLSTAEDLGSAGRDDTYGYGRVNAAAAVAYAIAPDPTPSATPTPTATPRPTPGASPSPTARPTPSATPSPSLSPTPTPDTTRPKVVGKTPASRKTGVDRDRNVKVRFSEAVRGVTSKTLRLVNISTGRVVRARVTYKSSTHVATLNPVRREHARRWYRVVVRAGITDLRGNKIARTSWRFKTGAR